MSTKKARRQPGGDTDNYGGRAFAVIDSLPHFTSQSQFNENLPWPDVDALADLLIAEVQLAQPNPPDDAYFRYFTAYGRYFGYDQECVL